MVAAGTPGQRGGAEAALGGEVPRQPMDGAPASAYAHATAPLRRLVDRYVGETCVALCAGQPLPDWVLAALPGLPATMADADRRASRFERAVIDLTEAVTLASRIGEAFDGAIVAVQRKDPRQGVVMLDDPAIEAAVGDKSPLPLGENVQVRLAEANPETRITRFELVHGNAVASKP